MIGSRKATAATAKPSSFDKLRIDRLRTGNLRIRRSLERFPTPCVILGRDPRIHPKLTADSKLFEWAAALPSNRYSDAGAIISWVLGSSPRMTGGEISAFGKPFLQSTNGIIVSNTAKAEQIPMTDLFAETSTILKAKGGSPFLFVGSGFSRRYLGIEDWKGLLARFCDGIADFDYYFATADGDLPKTAALIANDFHELWWKDEKYAHSREVLKEKTKSKFAALKNEISIYLSDVDVAGLQNEKIQEELNILRTSNVDGVITTNWDFLLEEIFPEYRVFIGQEELLFSNPQAIAEIYKIHGCASRPESLILTDKDYAQFNDRNPYLAAKIITLFIEHPIIFIGYSLADPHIQLLIFSIASCLGSEKLEQFSNNLIFVRWAQGRGDSIQKFTFSEGGRNVVATVLETDNYSNIYRAINECKRKIPTRILRYCKEQMYELVKSENPEEKLAVLDIDELESSEEVEFVVGVGVAKDHAQQQEKIAAEGAKVLSEHGYKGVAISDLYSDLPKAKSNFDAKTLLEVAFPQFAQSSTTFIPVFRYLSEVGITSEKELSASPFDDAKKIVKKIRSKGYVTKAYQSKFEREWSGKTTSDIIENVSAEKVAQFIPFQNQKDVEMEKLRVFLEKNHPSKFRDPYATYHRKLHCFYDRIAFGFDT